MKRFLKSKPTIYILPTRMGGYLGGLIFLMFLLSVGYNNNLLLIFTLVLFALNFIWLLQTHFHLHNLGLGSVMIQDGHAEESILVRINWQRAPKSPWNWELSLENDSTFNLNSLEHNEKKSGATLTIPKRGQYKWQHLRVKTDMPFGLYRAWKYYPISASAFIYPKRLNVVSTLEQKISSQDGEGISFGPGAHDLSSLGFYAGQETKRISWKHYARSGELLIKEGEDSKASFVNFSTQGMSQLQKEYLLSEMATQMIYCSRNEIPFTLNTTHWATGRGHTEQHLHACLRELALC